jgi:hypothetical protein
LGCSIRPGGSRADLQATANKSLRGDRDGGSRCGSALIREIGRTQRGFHFAPLVQFKHYGLSLCRLLALALFRTIESSEIIVGTCSDAALIKPS